MEPDPLDLDRSILIEINPALSHKYQQQLNQQTTKHNNWNI
jgi:hypothetical protein